MATGVRTVKFSEEIPQVFEYEKVDLPEEKKEERGKESEERKEWFTDFMAISMGIRTPVRLLDDLTFEGVAKYIASGQCSNIITMAGAGISTSAGIPDYRSPGTGLFDLLKDRHPEVKKIEDLFSIQKFFRDPVPFFERSKRFFETALEPTPCHYFVRLLHEKGLLLRHFTQNIDTLERLAGLPEDKLVEAHGSYSTSHCIFCDKEYNFEWMEERIVRDEIPRCEDEDCKGVIKPDIIMFGENLSERFAERVEKDSLKCDLLIIMGTSLAVLPFSTLTSKVKTSCPRLFINLDRGKTSRKHPMLEMVSGGSFDFDSDDNYRTVTGEECYEVTAYAYSGYKEIRDVYKEAQCDAAVYQLADMIGWGDELRGLVDLEHGRFLEAWKSKGKTTRPPSESTKTDTEPAGTPRAGGDKPADKRAASGRNAKAAGVTSSAKFETSSNSQSATASVSGKATASVRGKYSSSVSGKSTTPVSGKSTASVSGKSSTSVTGKSTASVSGKSTTSVSGKSAVKPKSSTAMAKDKNQPSSAPAKK